MDLTLDDLRDCERQAFERINQSDMDEASKIAAKLGVLMLREVETLRAGAKLDEMARDMGVE